MKLNLFRISWYNEPVTKGGLYQEVANFIEIPKEIHGLKCRLLMNCDKFFPTGSHKVGASYGPLVTRLTTGLFSPKVHKALWPSTGNYCRGGAFNSALMHSPCIAVLPEDMSQERFDLHHKIGAEVVKTLGDESNVKELFDMNKNKLLKVKVKSNHLINSEIFLILFSIIDVLEELLKKYLNPKETKSKDCRYSFNSRQLVLSLELLNI